MDCLKVHLVRRKRVDGMKIDEFIDNCESSRIYLLDVDPYFGREMNFKVYRELSGIFDLWIDSAPRKVEDVVDVLISDAEIAVLTGVYFWDSLDELLEMTDNVAMRSVFPRHIERFLAAGGKIVILPRNMLNDFGSGEKYVIGSREVCPWKISN